MNSNKIELNDLYDYGYKIYQNVDYFKFSLDSLLLAEFIDIKSGHKNIIDLCSGNAPVPMILSDKYKNKINVTGVELQPEVYELGKKSIEYNKFGNINYINEDVKNLLNIYDVGSFDVVSCNPPYFKKYSEENINENKIKAIARHEITVSLDDIIRISSKLLKNQGYFYMVHRAERLADIMELFTKYKFGLKRLQPVYSNRKSECNLILVEAIYNGQNYVKINSPIFLEDIVTYKGLFGDDKK